MRTLPGWHLHPNGGGLVQDCAHVEDSVFVGPEAKVFNSAQVTGPVRIAERGQVYGKAHVSGLVHVGDDSKIFGGAVVSGDTTLHNRAQVYGAAQVVGGVGGVFLYDDSKVYGNSVILGDDIYVCNQAIIHENAKLYDGAQVLYDAEICGDAKIFGMVMSGKHAQPPLCVVGSRHKAVWSGANLVSIGCETHSISWWLENENYVDVGDCNGYFDYEIEEYKQYLELFKKRLT